MRSGEFAPFAPRRVVRTVAAVDDGSPADELPVAESVSAQAVDVGQVVDVEQAEVDDSVPTGEPAPQTQPPAPPSALADTTSSACTLDDSQLLEIVRTRAIELATAACARALRVAALEDPRVVVRFVDEALAIAAGNEVSVVRVSAHDARSVADRGRAIAIDERLAPGDVVIETAAGNVEGDIDERARSLTRRAAHA